MADKEFEVDDLVWAKMKGFPPWPGQIAQPNDKVKPLKTLKSQHFVFFFGTQNFAWILDEQIMPHSRKMVENAKYYKKKPATLQRAIEEIERIGSREDKAASGKSVKEEPSPNVKESDEIETPSMEEKQPEEEEIVKTPKKDIVKSPKKEVTTPKIEVTTPKKEVTTPKMEVTTPKKEIVKTLKKATPKLSQRKMSPSSEGSPAPRKKAKAIKKRRLPKAFETYAAETMELDIPGYHYTSPTLPPMNGFSKVAIIPPYKEQASSSEHQHVYPRPPTPELDLCVPPKNKNQEMKIQVTPKKIGFLGIGMMGRGMVKNLLATGHLVTIWNRTESKCELFVKAGAKKANTPMDVVMECDIIFCCVSNPAVAKALVFGNCGVLAGLSDWSGGCKGYVEMSSVDPVTSREIAEAVSDKGCRYLEAPIIGTRELAEEGQLLILGAGDRELFKECESCFFAVAQMAFYLSCDVGSGSKMNLIMSMLTGTTLVAMAEAITLVEKCKLSTENFLEILGVTPFAHPLLMDKARAMVNNQYNLGTALKHQQKDMALAIGIGHTVEQPLSLAVAANEIYKRAKQLHYADHDVAAVSLGSKASTTGP